MHVRKKIEGFLHYRNDLGDGVRSGVVFADCSEPCSRICSSFSFIPEHEFCDDTPERGEYTSSELVNYLKEEKAMCYAKELGITSNLFTEKNPLILIKTRRGTSLFGFSLSFFHNGFRFFYNGVFGINSS